jgi:hypothetical protein
MEIGRFILLNQLSSGPSGAVWKAHDPQLGRDIVMRQLALAGPDQQPRIVAEADAAARLSHPAIARSYGSILEGGSIWLVEEWVDGASLAMLVPPYAQLSTEQNLGVLHRVLEGLAEAHRQGLVHGSVSPRTIVVDLDGTPKLVEFAGHLGHPEAAGSGPYASPEAFAGAGLTPAADVFSAGSVILERLRGADPAGRAAADRVLADVQPVLDRATAADPRRRQPNAQVLLTELDQAADRRGVLWWTTEGLGAAASSAAGAAAAGGAVTTGGLGVVAGSSGSAGAGAVSGSLNLQGAGAISGAGAQPGIAAGVVAGSARQGFRFGKGGLIAVVAGAVAVVVVAVSVFAFGRSKAVDAGPAPQVNASTQVAADPTTIPPIPTPSATPKPPAAQGFTGTYRYQSVVTKVVGANVRVGQKETATWTVTTTCNAGKCTSVAKTPSGVETLTSTKATWSITVNSKAKCVNTLTNKPTGQQVPMRYTQQLKGAGSKGDQLTKITGSDRYRQLKLCTNQRVAKFDIDKLITITFVKS